MEQRERHERVFSGFFFCTCSTEQLAWIVIVSYAAVWTTDLPDALEESSLEKIRRKIHGRLVAVSSYVMPGFMASVSTDYKTKEIAPIRIGQQ